MIMLHLRHSVQANMVHLIVADIGLRLPALYGRTTAVHFVGCHGSVMNSLFRC